MSFLKLQNVTLFGTRVVADVISYDEVLLIKYGWYPYRERYRNTQGNCHMVAEAEIGVMHQEGKNWWKPQETRKMQGRIFPESLRRESVALITSWCWTSSHLYCDTINFCCFGTAAPGNQYITQTQLSVHQGGIWVPGKILPAHSLLWPSILNIQSPKEEGKRKVYFMPLFMVI
jgi:hypothetical protein